MTLACFELLEPSHPSQAAALRLLIYDYDLNASTPEAGGACLCTKYEVRGTIAMFVRVARKKVVCLASLTRRNGLNEPGEDFIGTRVNGNRIF